MAALDENQCGNDQGSIVDPSHNLSGFSKGKIQPSRTNLVMGFYKPFIHQFVETIMPELPEVNTVQKLFHAEAVGHQIHQVEVWEDHILRNISGDEFIRNLSGRPVTGTYRRGKYLFALLDRGQSVLLHLGMTGDLRYYHDPMERSRYERFHWLLSNGRYVGFDDPRKFGRILLLDDIHAYINETGLGPDALEIEESEWLAKMKGRTTPIKAWLLDQSMLAGVGNLYADEICYQARVHPTSITGAIPLKKQKELYERMKSILTLACERDAYYKVYPEDWFWKWREPGAKNPNGPGVAQSAKIGGRTTYFVEGWQKRY